MLLKVSAALWSAVNDHLIGCHMIATNTVITAAVQNLSINHPVRRILHPFCFRTVSVNNRALISLLAPGNVFEHASCYSHSNLLNLMELGIQKCELLATPQERIANAGPNIQKLSNDDKFPYGSHSIKLYNCFAQFIENFLAHVYDSDEQIRNDNELQNFALELHNEVKVTKSCPQNTYETKEDVIKVLATFMFNATGMHEYNGAVSEYLNHPGKLGFRLREDSTSTDFQSWILALLIFTSTSVAMPKLLNDFNECYTKDYERNEWKKCLVSLQNLSCEIQKENEEKLKHPFCSFDPENLECSVSV